MARHRKKRGRNRSKDSETRSGRLGELRRAKATQQGRYLAEVTTIQQLLALEPAAFEVRMGMMFGEMGYQVQVSRYSRDGGIDLYLIAPDGRRVVAQCKRYANKPIGEPTVRDLYGAMVHEGAQAAILVTTSGFTGPAVTWAQGKPIRLLHGGDLGALLVSQQQRQTVGQTNQSMGNWLYFVGGVVLTGSGLCFLCALGLALASLIVQGR